MWTTNQAMPNQTENKKDFPHAVPILDEGPKNGQNNPPKKQAATSSKEAPLTLLTTPSLDQTHTLSQPSTGSVQPEKETNKPTHVIGTATDEQLINFICNIISPLMQSKTETDIKTLVISAANKLMRRKDEHLQHGRD